MILDASSSLLFVPGTLPFTVALAMMLLFGLLEVVSALLGMGLSGLIDGALPDIDVDADVDVDTDISMAGGHGFMDATLAWLCFGRVPILVLFLIFLSAFGLVGLSIQYVIHGVTGHMLPAALASIPAFFAALPVVRVVGSGLAKILPKDETDAVSRNSFVGRVATIGQATASRGNPAQAKLRDQHGQAHYVLVEPDEDAETLESGCEVLIVRQAGVVYFAIRNTSAALSPQ